MSSLPPCRSILMVGTDLAGTGGIRAVVCGYIDAGLFDRYRCIYVATHCPGSAWTKAAMAVRGWWRVARALATLDAPLVHIQTASRASFWRKSVVCLLARAARRPYLLHVHGGEFMKFYGEESSRLAQRFIRHTLAHAALIIALSQEWRERLARIAPTARIEVVPNGVRLPDIQALDQPRDREPSVLFVGDLIRAKGVYDLLHAFSRIAARFPHLELTCAGGGEIEALRRLAAEHGLQRRVACPGWLGPDRLRAEFAGASVFVLPSYAEGMPMALLEAMSWGLPVIATPVGGVPQVIAHEENGLLVGPGDIEGLAAAMARLLSEAALRERLGAAARRTIETRFSLDVTLDRLGEVYRRFGMEPHKMTRGSRPARAAAKARSLA